MNKYIYIFVLGLCIAACEKREEIHVDFPHENDLFCEIIGVPAQGFFGQITKINSVTSTYFNPISGAEECTLSIYEDNTLIYNQLVNDGSYIFIPYNINENSDYELNCNCKDYHIQSKTPKTAPPNIVLNNSSAYRQYVDSLGLNVVDINYDISYSQQEDLFYYAYNEILSSSPLFFDYNIISTAELGIPTSENNDIHRYKRLPSTNFSDYFANIFVVSIDKDLFQYTRNIRQLGLIPNDDIANHHGNLEGGVGYFGIIRVAEQYLAL